MSHMRMGHVAREWMDLGECDVVRISNNELAVGGSLSLLCCVCVCVCVCVRVCVCVFM